MANIRNGKNLILLILTVLLGTVSFCLPADAPSGGDHVRKETVLLADDVTATVYNAVESQCNSDPTRTASMFILDKSKIPSYRIIAMERTMMQEYGLAFGDEVFIEGAGAYDGTWQIQDLLNKRFKGQHRIDFLVPDDVKTGKWNNIKIYRKIY